MMPVNLVLVRHGESEGNLVKSQIKKGQLDPSEVCQEFRDRHNSLYRLTDRGRVQARIAGKWLRDNLSFQFDRGYVSEYIRACETAANLGLPGMRWYREYHLRERDWGALDFAYGNLDDPQTQKELERRKRDGIFWAPPGGESVVNTGLRFDRWLDTLHRECSDLSVCGVLHGEFMWIARVKLENLSMAEYRMMDESKHPFNKIHNCQIIHYSRKNPITGELHKHLRFMRSVCPVDLTRSFNDWVEIERKSFTNEELLEGVSQVPQLYNVEYKEKPGFDEGDKCGIDGCQGVLGFPDPEGCSCHIIAPCFVCENLVLRCSDCGREIK